jgi:hypothetical protein
MLTQEKSLIFRTHAMITKKYIGKKVSDLLAAKIFLLISGSNPGMPM